MIELKVARESSFAESTRAELRAYAEELGLDNVAPSANSATLRAAVMNALGMAPTNVSDTGPHKAKPITSSGGSDNIFPSYNLGPQGIWGGLRHRMSIPRPDGAKAAQAEGFAWNGKHTYYLPYDEVTDVPEPIFRIIATNKRRRPVEDKHPDGMGGNEITTKWEFDSMPMNYIGVDPVTKNRAGSLMEWYQSRGTDFFDALTLRQMTLIAGRCEVRTVQVLGPGVPPRPFSEDELRGVLKEFFFGYADAVAEANENIEP